MKASSVFFIIPLALLITVSCGQGAPKETEFQKQLREEREARAKLQKEYADSTVNLSFCGIKLGEPFKATLNAAQKARTIKKLKYDTGGESATCQGEIYIAGWDKSLPVDVKVTSYQDTITSFLVMCKKYEDYKAIWRLYTDRYNADASTSEDKADAWLDNAARSGSYSLIWTFKNQTLRMTDFYREEREWYVKNPNMKHPDNRYDIKYTKYFQALTIIYSDLRQCAKVEAVEAKEKAIAEQKQAKKRAAAQEKQAAQDRANREREATQDI